MALHCSGRCLRSHCAVPGECAGAEEAGEWSQRNRDPRGASGTQKPRPHSQTGCGIPRTVKACLGCCRATPTSPKFLGRRPSTDLPSQEAWLRGWGIFL